MYLIIRWELRCTYYDYLYHDRSALSAAPAAAAAATAAHGPVPYVRFVVRVGHPTPEFR